MIKFNRLIGSISILLTINLFIPTTAATAVTSSIDTQQAEAQQHPLEPKNTRGKKPLTTGYSVDGRSSASVLAAKRSHSVSDQDKNSLAIFSGLFVIALIVFFSGLISRNK